MTLKNCTPFTYWITKVDGAIIDDAEDLDFIVLICHFTEYSSNYSDVIVKLWCHSKDEATNFGGDILIYWYANTNDFRSFKYEAILLGNTITQGSPNEANKILENVSMAVPLKYLRISGGCRKWHWLLAKLNWNLNGRSTVF